MANRGIRAAIHLLLLMAVVAGGGLSVLAKKRAASSADLQVVDCLLPGKVKRLGQYQTYVTRRVPVRVPASVCRIRGGEYTESDRANLKSSLAIWLDQAKAGDAEAQSYVGEMFEKGLGVAPDHATAAIWYRRAADQGFARAQMNLGHLLEQGLGVERDPIAALGWYRKAVGIEGAIAVEDTVGRSAESRTNEELEPLRDALQQALEESLILRQRLDRLSAERASSTELEQRRARELESSLDATRAQFGHARSEVTRLEEEIALQRRQAGSRPTAKPALTQPPPVIELIDPRLSKTRGVQLVSAGASLRSVIGRVTAPGGLFSFTANGEEVAVDRTGLFKTAIALEQEPSLLSLVAIDLAGQRATYEIELAVRKSEKRPPPPPRVDFGQYHALIVGNNSYDHLADLATAATDARLLDDLLRAKFGFKTKLLLNATRYEILSALNELREKLTDQDNLLVYYAGHGELDAAIQRGYWLPVDAERQSTANWIATTTITDYLSVINARHAIVISDSCYSGALTRSAIARLESGISEDARTRWLAAMRDKRSRTALSSGGLEPVLDSGGGKSSVFTRALLDVLTNTPEILEGRKLYTTLAASVTHSAAMAGAQQVPEYAPIHFAGHEGGDFLFVPGN